jgi:hypothetical protein
MPALAVEVGRRKIRRERSVGQLRLHRRNSQEPNEQGGEKTHNFANSLQDAKKRLRANKSKPLIWLKRVSLRKF